MKRIVRKDYLPEVGRQVRVRVMDGYRSSSGRQIARFWSSYQSRKYQYRESAMNSHLSLEYNRVAFSARFKAPPMAFYDILGLK